MKQFRESWMRDTPGVIVAMRYREDKEYNGLCVWKQKKKIQVHVMPLTIKWINENYADGFGDHITSMTKQKGAFYRVPEDTVKTSGWFPMDTKKICGLKYKSNHSVKVKNPKTWRKRNQPKEHPEKQKHNAYPWIQRSMVCFHNTQKLKLHTYQDGLCSVPMDQKK